MNNAWGGEEGGPGMVNPEGDGYLPLASPPSQCPPPILTASSLVTLSPEASPLTASPTWTDPCTSSLTGVFREAADLQKREAPQPQVQQGFQSPEHMRRPG